MTTPHRCPVCEGRGTVPPGFYDGDDQAAGTGTAREGCRACLGTGLLWSLDPVPPPTVGPGGTCELPTTPNT